MKDILISKWAKADLIRLTLFTCNQLLPSRADLPKLNDRQDARSLGQLPDFVFGNIRDLMFLIISTYQYRRPSILCSMMSAKGLRFRVTTYLSYDHRMAVCP